MGRLSVTLPDSILEEIDRRAKNEGLKRPIWMTQFLSEHFGMDLLLCQKCSKVFSVEADEGSLREDGAWCNAHLHLSERDRNV